MWPKKIFVDTSMWIAYINVDDKYNKVAIRLISEHIKSGDSFFTSNDIIDETVTRLLYNTNWKNVERFIQIVEDGVQRRRIVQFWSDEEIQHEAFSLLEKFKEHNLSLTDATSVAIMKRYNLEAILTLDSDFKKIGIPSMP